MGNSKRIIDADSKQEKNPGSPGFFCGPELLAKELKSNTVVRGKSRYASRCIQMGTRWDYDTLDNMSTVKESDSRGNWGNLEIHTFPLSEVLPTKLHLSYI